MNRIGKRGRTPLFPTAAKEWIEAEVGKSESTLRNYRQYVDSLTSEFKDRLVCDIDISDIRTLQRKRLKQGLGHRSVNYEVGVLRQILKTFRLWHNLSKDVDSLKEKHDIGKALIYEDEEKLYAACAASRSPALLPLFVLCLDTSLRATEAKTLRRDNLKLEWQDGVIRERRAGCHEIEDGGWCGTENPPEQESLQRADAVAFKISGDRPGCILYSPAIRSALGEMVAARSSMPSICENH